MKVVRAAIGFAFAAAGLATVSDGQVFPAQGSDAQGVVLDESSRPIAGAAVRLLWETDPKRPFARATAHRLASTPLPETRSGRDGTFVLPLTATQRVLGDTGWNASGGWLVVSKEGYRSWCEPIHGGLPSYLGSRVILRRLDGDAFADVPWPPAWVTMQSRTSMAPWVPAGAALPELDRRGAVGLPQARAAVQVEQMATLELRVTASGMPKPRVALSFGDGSYARPAGSEPLPLQVGDDGCCEVRLPSGKNQLRLAALGHLTKTLTVELETAARTRLDVQLLPAEVVDVLAVTKAGVPVPFTRLDVIPKAGQSTQRSSFFVFSDSAGRARLFLDAADEWFVYGDFGAIAERFPLDRESAGLEGIVRVTKKWPVTVRIHGDAWPKQGSVRWDDGTGLVHERGFEFEAMGCNAVVFRMVHREDVVTAVGGSGGVPFVIRREDLPPMPAEPLLDLVALDRTLRPRATLLPRSTNGDSVTRFAVRPSWQADAAVSRVEAVLFARQVEGTWTLFARDAGTMDLVATAAKHEPWPFVVPAAALRAEVPVVPLELVPR